MAILNPQQQVIHPALAKRDFLVQLYGTKDRALHATSKGLFTNNVGLFTAVGFTEAEWMKLAGWLLDEEKRRATRLAEADARQCLLQ